MIREYEELTLAHPCFAMHKKVNKGRIHLPVSPGCNIHCRFCDRQINWDETRPGVSGTVLSPEEALEVTGRALRLCPEISVAGIAGPGDTLASPYALETFRLLAEKYPELIRCMSTNGLLLAEKADEVIDVGIDSLTVTVNAVNPDIESEISSGAVYHGRLLHAGEAAVTLIANQEVGIRRVSAAGVTVKVNMVLIPEINADHVAETARAVKAWGARIFNLIPLIPQHELSWCTEPGCTLLSQARAEAGAFLDVFRHCQRCRADAAGLLGGADFSAQIYQRPVPSESTFSHG
jgi:nitrogen fixation protein NifB